MYCLPLFYLYHWSELSSYDLVGSGKINSITQQQAFWEEIPKTRKENSPRPSRLSSVAELQCGVSQDPRCYAWPFLCCVPVAFDLSVAIQESLRTAVFNLRCDSISVTKRCFPICTLHVIWNLNERLWGFWVETYWPWANLYFCQRARWSEEGTRSFLLSICAYSE